MAFLFGMMSLNSAAQQGLTGRFEQNLGIQLKLKKSHSIPLTQFNKKALATFATIGSVAYLMTRFDRQIDEDYTLQRHGLPFHVINAFGHVGEFYDGRYTNYFLGGMLAAAQGYSQLGGRPAVAETAMMMAEALAYSSVITFVLKVSVGRNRPYAENGPYQFSHFHASLASSKMSFPSGHTSSIFTLMTVLAKKTQSRWVKRIGYTLATSVAFQRMMVRKHWSSDVIAGGVIGYVVGSWVTSDRRNRRGRLHVDPYPHRRGIGLKVAF